MERNGIFAVLLCCLAIIDATDPCSSHVYRLPYLNARYKHYILMTSYHADSALIPGWYSVEELTMLDHAPDLFFDCGTKYPIWLNGSHPVEVNELVERKACMLSYISNCQFELDIKVVKCSDNKYHYYLPATPAQSGYCFGVGVEGDPPTYQPVIGEIVHGLETIPYGRIELSRAYFTCTFTESAEENLFYKAIWYQDGIQLLLSDFANTSSHTAFKLTEEMFVENGFTLGHTLSCDVEAYMVENGAPGPRSDRAAGFFAGIKVLNTSLTFSTHEENEAKRTILLQPTIHIGCVGENNCKIELLASIPEESETCNGISLELARCGIEIEATNAVDTTLNLVLHTTETGQYDTDRHARIFLKIADHHENLIWPNYSLEPISVYLKVDGKGRLSEGKSCQSNDDPHMITLDGLRYELQPNKYSDGVYTLFKNNLFNSEVQIQITRCPPRWNTAYCNCGVAVRSGRDVYIISTCNGTLKMAYTNCDDSYLKVKSLGPSYYKIILPYGPYVLVYLHKMDSVLLMNVHVYPSTLDEGNTRGLCGTLDGDQSNEFHDEQGFVITEKMFIENWRIKQNTNNMLHNDFNKVENLIPYEYGVCICPGHTSPGPPPPLRPISCDKNAVASCSKGKDVSIHDCPDITRRRRSVDERPKIPTVTISINDDQNRYKRSESKTWTQDEAEAYCRDHMNESPLYALCEDVPNALPENAVYDCISDITLTGTTDWATVSRRTMQSVCGTELTRNMTLRKSEYNKPSVADIIERVLCDNECSGVGTCGEGVCQCGDMYGGSDCSIDLTVPPTMYGLLDDGLCDEYEYPCTHAYCFVFPVSDSSSLTCKLEDFYFSWSNERILVATYTVAAEFSSLIEAICPLEGFRRKRATSESAISDVFISGYTISISNDGGTLFSEGNDLFIYDSSCVNVEGIGPDISFSLFEGYCWIEGQCVLDGSVAATDNCSICNTTQSERSWSTNMEANECPSTQTATTTADKRTTTDPTNTNLSTATATAATTLSQMSIPVTPSASETTTDQAPAKTTVAQETVPMTTENDDTPEADQNHVIIVAVTISVAALLIIAIVIACIFKWNSKRQNKTLPETPESSPQMSRPPTRNSIRTMQDIDFEAEYLTPIPNDPPLSHQMSLYYGMNDIL